MRGKGKSWLWLAATLFVVLFSCFATGARAGQQSSGSAESKIYLSRYDCIPNAIDQSCGVNLDEYCFVATEDDSPLVGIEHKDPNGESVFLPRYLHAGELIAVNPITGHAVLRLCGNSCSSIRDPLDPSRQSGWLPRSVEKRKCKKTSELGEDPFRKVCVSSFKEYFDLLNPGQCLVRLWRPIGPLTLCDPDGNCITDYLRADTDVAIDPIDLNGGPECRELLFATSCRYKPQKKFCVPGGSYEFLTCRNKPGERNLLEGIILAPGVTDTDSNSINVSIEGTAEGTTHESVDSWEPGFWGGPVDVDPDGNPNVHTPRPGGVSYRLDGDPNAPTNYALAYEDRDGNPNVHGKRPAECGPVCKISITLGIAAGLYGICEWRDIGPCRDDDDRNEHNGCKFGRGVDGHCYSCNQEDPNCDLEGEDETTIETHHFNVGITSKKSGPEVRLMWYVPVAFGAKRSQQPIP